MRFEEYLARRAPASLRDYMRYYERLRHALGTLEPRLYERLPCNTWVLKLARIYVRWAMLEGCVDTGTAAHLLLVIQERERVCRGEIRGRGEGFDRCPEAPRPSGRHWVRVIQEAVAWSGARAKHLWLISETPRERVRRYGDVIVYDLRKTFGKKRVNIIPLPAGLAPRVLEVVSTRSYNSRRAVRDSTPWSCWRKYHYELCLAASDSEQLCDFIHGRYRPTSVKHYMDYVRRAAGVTARLKPGVEKLLEGRDLGEALLALTRAAPTQARVNLPEDKLQVNRVEEYFDAVTLPDAEGLREGLGDRDDELRAITTWLLLNPHILR